MAHDAVLVSFVEALLRDARVDFTVLDRNLAATHLFTGLLPQRVMVPPEQWQRAYRILHDAGLAEHLVSEQP